MHFLCSCEVEVAHTEFCCAAIPTFGKQLGPTYHLTKLQDLTHVLDKFKFVLLMFFLECRISGEGFFQTRWPFFQFPAALRSIPCPFLAALFLQTLFVLLRARCETSWDIERHCETSETSLWDLVRPRETSWDVRGWRNFTWNGFHTPSYQFGVSWIKDFPLKHFTCDVHLGLISGVPLQGGNMRNSEFAHITRVCRFFFGSKPSFCIFCPYFEAFQGFCATYFIAPT